MPNILAYGPQELEVPFSGPEAWPNTNVLEGCDEMVHPVIAVGMSAVMAACAMDKSGALAETVATTLLVDERGFPDVRVQYSLAERDRAKNLLRDGLSIVTAAHAASRLLRLTARGVISDYDYGDGRTDLHRVVGSPVRDREEAAYQMNVRDTVNSMELEFEGAANTNSDIRFHTDRCDLRFTVDLGSPMLAHNRYATLVTDYGDGVAQATIASGFQQRGFVRPENTNPQPFTHLFTFARVIDSCMAA